ncbi:MAG: competence type IV pilus minor pilin ComGG [Enterococcus sp.]
MKATGYCHKLKGGVMISAIMFLAIGSMLLLATLENQKVAMEFSIWTQKLYVARTIQELFWVNYLVIPEDERLENGQMRFNLGKVRYKAEGNRMLIWVDYQGESYYCEKELQSTEETVKTTENDSSEE